MGFIRPMTKVLRMEIKRTTPDDARKLLEKNYVKNRKPRKAHIGQLVSDMQNDLFNSMNGQTIVIDEEGVVYDGQHRLMAQVEADATIDWLFVVVDDGQAAWMTIDNAARRTLGDLMRDKDNANQRAALAQFAYACEYGDVPLASTLQKKKEGKLHVTRSDGLQYDSDTVRADMVTKALNRGLKIYSQLRCGGVFPYSSFCFLVAYIGDDEFLDDFVDDASSIAPDCKTVIAMQKKICKEFSQSKKPDAKWLLGVLFDAYDHFKLMDDSTQLNKMSTKFKRYEKLMLEQRKAKASA